MASLGIARVSCSAPRKAAGAGICIAWAAAALPWVIHVYGVDMCAGVLGVLRFGPPALHTARQAHVAVWVPVLVPHPIALPTCAVAVASREGSECGGMGGMRVAKEVLHEPAGDTVSARPT